MRHLQMGEYLKLLTIFLFTDFETFVAGSALHYFVDSRITSDCISIINFVPRIQAQLTLSQIMLIHSEPVVLSTGFSTLVGQGMSRLGSHWSRDVATPALLCHKEPARRIQSPLLGALERKIPPLGGILLAPRWFFMA